jgi:hypothetical protein
MKPMKKQKQFNVQRLYSKRSGVYKFAQDKRSEASDGVYFFDPEKKYHKGDAFVIPNMASFIHDVSEHGNIGALKKRVFKLNPFQLLRLAWWNKKNILSIAKKEFHAGVLMLIQIELLQIQKYKPSMVIVSDQVNDLSYSLNNKQILIGAQMLVKDKLNLPFAVMTNNLAVAVQKLADWNLKPKYIFTPFNRFGYEMNPDQTTVEFAAALVDPSRIVAITPELKQEDKAYLEKHGIENGMVNWF